MSIRNQRGQLAVFLALIFQVLFVLFAMSINVALVVHDKINLQASADLAAYYAAQKQAEYLHAIAHQNYLIRQSWKLLTWRYRYLGTLGLTEHPAYVVEGYRGGTLNRTEQVWPKSANNSAPNNAYAPAICAYYQPLWNDVAAQENLCKDTHVRIPELPEYRVVAPFNPINFIMRDVSRNLRMQYKQACAKRAAFNWFFSAAILKAFREDQKNRKQVIMALARAMSRSGSSIIDLDGARVMTGVENTIKKNLTRTNRDSLVGIELVNSLGGVDLNKWLVEVTIEPTLFYADSMQDDSNASCATEPKRVDQTPYMPEANTIFNDWDETGYLRAFAVNNDADMLGFSESSYSLGFEKNPWYQVYAGVRVQSQPRQLFFPFGGAVTLTAVGYAKPFGGRIGPWFSKTWPQTNGFSTGEKIDVLLPDRKNPGSNTITNSRGVLENIKRVPNYSRYPNDPFGLTTFLAHTAYSGITNAKASLSFYSQIIEDINEGDTKDILPWDYTKDEAPLIRMYELAAINPDLFDASYYTIIPSYNNSILSKIRANKSALGIPNEVAVRGDLGERFNGDNPIVSTSASANMNAIFGGSTPLIHDSAFYSINKRENLLTSWLPGAQAFKYDANTKNFGKCETWDDSDKASVVVPATPIPNSCLLEGGRTGYSVKMVSKSYLRSNSIPLGGSGVAPGRILNPPPW